MERARPLPSLAIVLVPVLALGLLAAPALAQDFDRYQVNTEPLADGLFLLTGAGGKVLARTGESGLLLVDTDYAEMHDKLQEALTALEAGPVRLVIDTHWHFDHVGGNEGFARDGAVIAAHESVRGWMAEDQRLPLLDTDVPASPPAALPALSCGDRLLLHWGGEEIAVVHAPRAHTGGDLLVHFRAADVIHAGDVIFSGGYPYIDTGHGGSIDGMIAAVETVLGMCGEGTRVVPGHGPVLSPDEVRRHLEMLRAFRAAIAAEMDAGRSLEAILAEPPTAELDAERGQRMFPPDLFTRMVHRSLAAE
jgi:glyoxylase-like metal-dependent hydrolase (beta-lactamase superfamily II)